MMNIPAIIARTAARRKTSVVVTEHMDLSQETTKISGATRMMRIAPALVRALYPHADGIVSVNARALDDPILVPLVRRLPHTVIGNPYTWDVVERAARGVPHRWLTETGRPPTFVAAGRLVKRKGFDAAIRALAKLRDQSIEAQLIVFGDGVERSALKHLAGELGLEYHVDLPGFTDNPFPSIAAADAFVLPSVVEGSPMVLLEAMPLGTPIVATSAGGTTSEILTDSKSGIIVPDDDVAALAQALEIVVRDPGRARLLGAEARRVSENRSPARVAQRYVDFFEDVFATRKA
jgi:glycosyltransferase involved in cell wall biosynthesis